MIGAIASSNRVESNRSGRVDWLCRAIAPSYRRSERSAINFVEARAIASSEHIDRVERSERSRRAIGVIASSDRSNRVDGRAIEDCVLWSIDRGTKQFSLYCNSQFSWGAKKRTSERSAKTHTLLAAWSGPERVVGCRGESQLERRERGSPSAGPHGTHALEDHSSNFQSCVYSRSLFTMFSKTYPDTRSVRWRIGGLLKLAGPAWFALYHVCRLDF